jgi:hypothetical protein
MKRTISVAAVFSLVVALLTLSWAPPTQAELPPGNLLAPDLSGDNEVPPVATAASGSAAVAINFNDGAVCFLIDTDLNQADITGAHIHVGEAGVNGGVVVDFGDIAADGFDGCVDGVAEATLQAILDNPAGHYVNVHTGDHPGGEIRDQLQASTAEPGSFEGLLDGDQEVPPSGSTVTGSIGISLDDDGFVCYEIQHTGFETAVTGAHIHEGDAGVNGPVVVDLHSDIFGGALGASGCVLADTETAAAIAANPGGYYVNVHTEAFPAGEIRGQLREAVIDVPDPDPEPSPGDVDATCAAYIAGIQLQIDLVFDDSSIEDPATLEAFLTGFQVIIDDMVEVAPEEILEEVTAFGGLWAELHAVLAAGGYDYDQLSLAQLDAIIDLADGLDVLGTIIDEWADANCDVDGSIEFPALPVSVAAQPVAAAPTFTG